MIKIVQCLYECNIDSTLYDSAKTNFDIITWAECSTPQSHKLKFMKDTRVRRITGNICNTCKSDNAAPTRYHVCVVIFRQRAHFIRCVLRTSPSVLLPKSDVFKYPNRQTDRQRHTGEKNGRKTP